MLFTLTLGTRPRLPLMPLLAEGLLPVGLGRPTRRLFVSLPRWLNGKLSERAAAQASRRVRRDPRLPWLPRLPRLFWLRWLCWFLCSFWFPPWLFRLRKALLLLLAPIFPIFPKLKEGPALGAGGVWRERLPLPLLPLPLCDERGPPIEAEAPPRIEDDAEYTLLLVNPPPERFPLRRGACAGGVVLLRPGLGAPAAAVLVDPRVGVAAGV